MCDIVPSFLPSKRCGDVPPLPGDHRHSQSESEDRSHPCRTAEATLPWNIELHDTQSLTDATGQTKGLALVSLERIDLHVKTFDIEGQRRQSLADERRRTFVRLSVSLFECLILAVHHRPQKTTTFVALPDWRRSNSIPLGPTNACPATQVIV
jgi:hypothetical protein